MTNSVIRVDGIRKQFRNQEVLKGVFFEVQAGQTYALLGRNGTGKTTLIRTLLGLLAPDSGTVGILGINPRTNPLAVRRRVGYLAEDQKMFGWMTVEQIVRFIADSKSRLLEHWGISSSHRVAVSTWRRG